MEHEPRDLSDFEREIIRLLMIPDYPGRDALRASLDGASAMTIDNYGSLKLIPRQCEKANIAVSVPVEGRAMDSDGVPIYVLLHAPAGIPTELEIYKADGSEIREIKSLLALEAYYVPPAKTRSQ